MAKKTDAAAASPTLASRVLVRLQSAHKKTPDQYEILVDGRRLAYVCEGGDQMPINWLSPEVIGLREGPTDAEKIAIATEARAQMAVIESRKAAEAAELKRLSGGA